MTIPLWLFILLIVTNFFSICFLFLIIYLICGIRDLFFVKYKKQIDDDKAPYYIEKEFPDDKK